MGRITNITFFDKNDQQMQETRLDYDEAFLDGAEWILKLSVQQAANIEDEKSHILEKRYYFNRLNRFIAEEKTRWNMG